MLFSSNRNRFFSRSFIESGTRRFLLISTGLLLAAGNGAQAALTDYPVHAGAGLGASIVAAPEVSEKRLKQRELYTQAMVAMTRGNTPRLAELKRQLRDYPLLAYLEYEDLRRRVHGTSKREVHEFFDRYPDSPLAFQLRDQWLTTLAREGSWAQFLEDYTPDMSSTGMRCYYHWAQYQTGQRTQALRAVPDIWRSGRSLPDACDPLLKVWRDQGGVTPELLRERIGLAIKADNWSLATYLARDLPPEQRSLIALYRRVHQQPRILGQTEQFRQDSPLMRQILLHGMQRYARQDAEAAAELWVTYQQLYQFSADERAPISHSLALNLATSFHPQAAPALEKALQDKEGSSLYEWQVRVALRDGQWEQVEARIGQMPAELKDSPRWRYWLARAREAQGRADNARELYTLVAQERDYYGFLAADHIGESYRLNHRPFPVSPDDVARVAKLPGLQRAQEFYLLGQLSDARREWRHATRRLSNEDILAVSNLVQQWGWYSQSIMGAIAAREWDDLQVRFPLVYQDAFTQHASSRNLDVNWVLALARQESAFVRDARSSKGALGLLQLLPTTAKETARSIGQGFHGAMDLLDPEINIRLGTAHLGELLGRFANNRILATAAYNAGTRKVRQWLANGGDRLSYDVWVETVPYYETRQYVQNVLAYSVIYGHRRGKNPRLLVDHEVACVCLDNAQDWQ